MICPSCSSNDLKIEKTIIANDYFHAPIYYAFCNELLYDDPNWGGGGDYCDFFIARESKAELLKELNRLIPDLNGLCPYCKGTGKGKMNKVEVGCTMCSKTGKL
jgi:hypothetical protein